MKSRKLLAGVLVAVLFAVTVTQTAFAEGWEPINEQADVPAGDITIEQTVTNDGVYGVMPAENITLNGNLTITAPASTQENNRVVGVLNETIETTEKHNYTVQTKNIVIQAADTVECITIGVSEAGGKTIVDGNITADTYGIEYSDGTVICTGTVEGKTAAISVAGELGEAQKDSIVVYELKSGTGGRLISFDADGEAPTEDVLLSRINYIIKKSGAADAITFSEGVRQVEGYDTAHSGDAIRIKLASGYEFGSSNTVKAVLQADGSYLVTVPREGGVTLSAILQAVTVAEESGSSAPATTKQYTDEQLKAVLEAYGGTLVSTYAELTKALAGGVKVLFVTSELMQDLEAAKALFAALKAGGVKVYKVMDSGAIMSTAVKGSAIVSENCGDVKTIAKSKDQTQSGKTGPVQAAPNPGVVYDRSASGLFSNSFTKTEGKAAGIINVVLNNEYASLTIPVDSLTDGGTAGMTSVLESGTVKKLIADNFLVGTISEAGTGKTLAGQENIQVNFVNAKAGNIRQTIKLPEGAKSDNIAVNDVTQYNVDWTPPLASTYSMDGHDAAMPYREKADGI